MPIPIVIDHKLRVRLADLPDGVAPAIMQALSIPNVEKAGLQKQMVWGWERLPDEIELYEVVNGWLVMPRGFWLQLQEGMQSLSLDIEWVDHRTFENSLEISARSEPRPWQVPAITAIVGCAQGIYKAPAGSGKTVTVLLAIRELGCKSLVIVNTKDVMWQWQERITDHLEGVKVGQVGDNIFEIGDITIATAQTLHRRFEALEAERFFDLFSFVCLDECFPTGTPVATPQGPRPIESLRVGDVVYGVNHSTGQIEPTEVRHTFEKNADRLVDLEGVQMTPNHPVFTQRGYIRADDVVIGDTITFLDASEATAPTNLRAVWAGLSGMEADRTLLHEALLDPRSSQQTGQSVQDGRRHDESEIAFDQTRSGLLVPTGRERAWSDRAAESSLGGAGRGVGAGVHLQDRESDSWAEEDCRGAVALQDRLSERVEEDRRGVGRREPSIAGSARAGLAEDIMARSSRLEGLAREEQGRAALHIPGHRSHRVFNVETGLGNYFAGGLLVHNCHHATADTYQRVLDRFSAAYRVGVSATPDKTGDFRLATNVLGDIFHVTYPEDVTSLMRPKVIRVPTKFGFGFRGTTSRWQRSNYPQMIDALIRDDDRNRLICEQIYANAGHHQLVISKRLEHLSIIRDLLEDAGFPDPIVTITGSDGNDDRIEAKALAETEPCVILSTLADEALDIPRLDRLHLPFPQRNAGLVTQQAGRIERRHPDKKDAIIYDYSDGNVGPLEAQWRSRRFEVYGPRGYVIERA